MSGVSPAIRRNEPKWLPEFAGKPSNTPLGPEGAASPLSDPLKSTIPLPDSEIIQSTRVMP